MEDKYWATESGMYYHKRQCKCFKNANPIKTKFYLKSNLPLEKKACLFCVLNTYRDRVSDNENMQKEILNIEKIDSIEDISERENSEILNINEIEELVNDNNQTIIELRLELNNVKGKLKKYFRIKKLLKEALRNKKL